jgi:DHA2 family multidrug resistance protein
MDKMRYHFQHEAGASSSNIAAQSRMMLLTNVNRQAYIQGINDDFLLAGFITLIGGIPVFFLRTKKSKNEKKSIHA